jgi:anti-anti-sigma factor
MEERQGHGRRAFNQEHVGSPLGIAGALRRFRLVHGRLSSGSLAGLWPRSPMWYSHNVSVLEITVEAGSSGPVVKLSGESDLTTAGRLRDALAAQLAPAPRRLTVDARGLRFADSASIQVLLAAHRVLHDAGGSLELVLRPGSVIARALSLLGADQVLTIRTEAGSGDQPVIP